MAETVAATAAETAAWAAAPAASKEGIRMIRMQGIRKEYHMGDSALAALDGVDIHIKPHEFVSIIGPSGSGKSTLMNIIGCLDTACLLYTSCRPLCASRLTAFVHAENPSPHTMMREGFCMKRKPQAGWKDVYKRQGVLFHGQGLTRSIPSAPRFSFRCCWSSARRFIWSRFRRCA